MWFIYHRHASTGLLQLLHYFSYGFQIPCQKGKVKVRLENGDPLYRYRWVHLKYMLSLAWWCFTIICLGQEWTEHHTTSTFVFLFCVTWSSWPGLILFHWPWLAQLAQSPTNAVTVSSSPGYAAFLIGLMWEGLQQPADGQGFNQLGTAWVLPTIMLATGLYSEICLSLLCKNSQINNTSLFWNPCQTWYRIPSSLWIGMGFSLALLCLLSAY